MAALLSDGRLWLRQRALRRIKVVGRETVYSALVPMGRFHAGFAPGSDWRDMAASDLSCFAIRADGTLWDLSGPQLGSGEAAAGLVQVGDSRGWIKLSAGSQQYCGLKNDGTLWEWRNAPMPAGASGGRFRAPAQVGADTNWIAAAGSTWGNVAVKADGTIWRWGELQSWPSNGPARFETLARPQQWLAYPGKQRPVSISFGGPGVAVVCADGSLWMGGGLPYGLLSQKMAQTARTEMVRYGEAPDREHVELVGNLTGVGIKRDGSMWTWDTGGAYWRGQYWRGWVNGPLLVPLSDYAVWASVCYYGRASLALGRDGTLCLWGDPHFDPNLDPTGRYFTRLLLPSRIHAVQIANLSH